MKSAYIAAALVVSIAAPAAAAERVKVGRLQCEVASGLGMIIGSSKEMECRFVSDVGRSELYHGRINKFGLDLGGTQTRGRLDSGTSMLRQRTGR